MSIPQGAQPALALVGRAPPGPGRAPLLMGMVDGAAPLDPASEGRSGSSAPVHAYAQNCAFEGSEQTRASSGSISPRERAMEALEAIARISPTVPHSHPAEHLDYELLRGMERAVHDVFNSKPSVGEDSSSGLLELKGLVGSRDFNMFPVALAAVCARALGVSLPAQIQQGERVHICLLHIGKRLQTAVCKHANQLKALDENLRKRHTALHEAVRQRAALVASFLGPVKKDELLAAVDRTHYAGERA